LQSEDRSIRKTASVTMIRVTESGYEWQNLVEESDHRRTGGRPQWA